MLLFFVGLLPLLPILGRIEHIFAHDVYQVIEAQVRITLYGMLRFIDQAWRNVAEVLSGGAPPLALFFFVTLL